MFVAEASDSVRKTWHYLLHKMVYFILLGCVSWAIYSSCRLAIADHLYSLDTPDSVRAAVQLEPANADYHALLAEHEERSGASPEPQLLTAISLSPLTSRYLI